MSDKTEQHDDQANQHEGAGKRPMALTSEIEGLIAAAREAFSSEVAYQRARAILASKIAGRIAGLAAWRRRWCSFAARAGGGLAAGTRAASGHMAGAGHRGAGAALGHGGGRLAALRAWRRLKGVLTGKAKP
jgi:hypothetical protein